MEALKRSTEPLTSELTLNFEPLSIPFSSAFKEDFIGELTTAFGPGVVMSKHYARRDLERLADVHGNSTLSGKDVEDALNPDGFDIRPAGELVKADNPIVVNRMSGKDDRINVNVRGTTDGCLQAAKALVTTLDRVSADHKTWEQYESKIVSRAYGTATYVTMPADLRGFIFGSPLANVLDNVVEHQLSSYMGPQRGGKYDRVAFVRTMIHEIGCWVLVVGASGSYQMCRLDFDHLDDDSVADRGVMIVSEMDYISHMKLIDSLRTELEKSLETENHSSGTASE